MREQAAHHRALLVLCCLAQFMIVLDVSIVNVALPSIRQALDFGGSELQWVVNAYTLAFAGFLLLGGRAADLIGQRPVFVAGMLVFAGASLAGALAPTKEVLVVARALQGIGGAIVAPATLSVLSTTFTEGAERNHALGWWGAMGAVGGAAGGLVGGVLTELLGWRWILLINLPIGVMAAAVAWRLVADTAHGATERRFDLAGAVTVTAGLVVLTFGIVGAEQHGWTSGRTLGTMGAGLALLALFVVIESRVADAPLVPLRVFGSRRLTGANVVVFALGSAAFAMWYFVSLYLQEVLGYTAIEAGLAFLPMPVTIMVCSTLAGRLVTRSGPRATLAVGMALIATGMVLFARVDVDGTWFSDVLAPSILTAAGIGLSFVPVTIAAVSGASPGEAGLASGLVNTSRQIGGSLGLAVLATLATAHTATLLGSSGRLEALVSGYHRAFAVGAGFAAAGAVAAVLMLGGGSRSAAGAVPAPAQKAGR